MLRLVKSVSEEGFWEQVEIKLMKLSRVEKTGFSQWGHLNNIVLQMKLWNIEKTGFSQWGQPFSNVWSMKVHNNDKQDFYVNSYMIKVIHAHSILQTMLTPSWSFIPSCPVQISRNVWTRCCELILGQVTTHDTAAHSLGVRDNHCLLVFQVYKTDDPMIHNALYILSFHCKRYATDDWKGFWVAHAWPWLVILDLHIQ